MKKNVFMKIGCNWGTKQPSFYNFMLEESLIIVDDRDMFFENNYVLVCEGFNALCLAKIIGKPTSVIKRADLENKLLPFEIPYRKKIKFSQAIFYELEEDEKFQYKTQKGIVQIKKREIKNKIVKIVERIESEIFIPDEKDSEFYGKLDLESLENNFSLPKNPETPKTLGKNRIYPRDKSLSLYVLQKSNFQCEVDPNHKSFISKKFNKPYMEAHHLIPLSKSALFTKSSLDIEPNIVCLCSECHNEIHYGVNSEELISKLLTEKRIEALKKQYIEINVDELIKFYRSKNSKEDIQ